MTDQIRDAAQALYSACCNYGSQREQDIRDAAKALGAALTAPQPAADERVAEHMKHVEASAAANNLARYALDDFIAGKPAGGLEAVNARCAEAAEALSAAQASARALLTAGRDDAEHAAMYRWLRFNREAQAEDGTWLDVWDEHGSLLQGDELDAAIRSAMQKGTP